MSVFFLGRGRVEFVFEYHHSTCVSQAFNEESWIWGPHYFHAVDNMRNVAYK